MLKIKVSASYLGESVPCMGFCKLSIEYVLYNEILFLAILNYSYLYRYSIFNLL